jgi:hypothetical protein
VRDIDFYLISAVEISKKFKKTSFWKEKSVENVVTLGPTAQTTLVIIKLRPSLHKGPGSIDRGSKIGSFGPIIRLNKKKLFFYFFKNWAQELFKSPRQGTKSYQVFSLF